MSEPARDPLAPEESADAPREAASRAGQGGPRVTFALLALAFFMVPSLILLAGGASDPLPRERKAATPALADGWEFLDDTTAYVGQTLPLRADAVEANTWISRNVFGETPRYGRQARGGANRPLALGGTGERPRRKGRAGYAETGGAAAPNPVVASGRRGWYFLQGEIDTACRPPVGFDTAVERWARFIRIIRDSGRRVVFVAVPEKSTIYPEFVKPETPSWACAQRQKARLWSRIEALQDPDAIPLRQPLLELKRRNPRRLLYLPLNTHWNDRGPLLLSQRVLEHVGGGVRIKKKDIVVGRERLASDLLPLIGTNGRADIAPSINIRRRGEGPIRIIPPVLGAPARRLRAPKGTLIRGTTLYLQDSFGEPAVPLLAHYASKLIIASWLGTKPAVVPKLLARSRTVIVETVERDFLNRAATKTPQSVLTPRFLDRLERRLKPLSG